MCIHGCCKKAWRGDVLRKLGCVVTIKAAAGLCARARTQTHTLPSRRACAGGLYLGHILCLIHASAGERSGAAQAHLSLYNTGAQRTDDSCGSLTINGDMQAAVC